MGLMLLWRLLNGPPKPRCQHSWELVDKTEFPSSFDELKRIGIGFDKWSMGTDWWMKMCTKKVVLVIRCPKCDHAPILKELANL